MKLKSLAKSSLLSAVSALTGRHAVLLPREARCDESILRLSTKYRVEGSHLDIDIHESAEGSLSMQLLGYEGHFPTRTIWHSDVVLEPPSRLTLNLENGDVTLAGRPLGKIDLPLPGRRFCWRLELATKEGTKRRTTGHYLVVNNKSHGREYYKGGNYVDYESEAQGDLPKLNELLRKFDAREPVLEVGCATGVVLESLRDQGLDTYGIDLSDWAVARAQQRVGAKRAFVGDVENYSLPKALVEHGPFATVVLWAVLEHFHKPFSVLSELSQYATPDAKLFINTTNARSLNHLLFDSEWEGYFDSTHLGIDEVSVASLRSKLPELGWRVELLETHLSWSTNPDPTHASIREWWASDARFRRLLRELDRGDLITCVATRG